MHTENFAKNIIKMDQNGHYAAKVKRRTKDEKERKKRKEKKRKDTGKKPISESPINDHPALVGAL